MFSLKRQSFRKSKKLETLATALTIGAALIAACSSAYSKEGGGPGNGGDAVFLNGKWQLLDLAEAGITKSEFFDDALSYMEKHRSKPHSSLSRAFVYATFVDSRFTPAFKEALAATLHQSIDAPTLMAVMRMYQWQLTDAPLRQIGDEKSTLDLSQMNVKQLAIRLDDRVQIYAPIFLEMDLLNQVATIHHELVYALTTPIPQENGIVFQPSWQARSHVACVFSGYGNCGTMAEKTYSEGRYVFEGTLSIDRIEEVTNSYSSNATRRMMYSGTPSLILCPSSVKNVSLRQRGRHSAMLGSPVLSGGAEAVDCSTMNGRFSIYSSSVFPSLDGGQIASIEDLAQKFCQPNHQGRITKKTNGDLIAYSTAPSVYWDFEEIITEQGLTKRPVVDEGDPSLKIFGSTVLSTASFGSYEGCLESVRSIGKEFIETANTQRESLYRRFGQ